MPVLELSPRNTLSYEYEAPSDSGLTLVGFNPLTGDRSMWQAAVGAAARENGHGLLIYNMRGQAGSDFTFTQLDEAMIVEDARALLDHVRPRRPLHMGLSIGGLFALKAHLGGGSARAEGIVLINTLRRSGPRLDWINDATVRMADIGGLDMLRDLFAPLLFNEDWQAANRANFLKPGPYQKLDSSEGAYMLLASGGTADWDVAYESVDVPVLSITGMQDRVFRDPADIDALFARIPDGRRIEMENAGHMVPVEQPEAFASAVIDFANTLKG